MMHTCPGGIFSRYMLCSTANQLGGFTAMIYTKKTPWTLIMGVIMAGYAYMVSAGAMEPLIKFLGTSKNMGEMVTLGYAFGGIAIAVGLWQLLATPKQGQGDYYLSTIAGLTFIMLLAFVVEWGLGPLVGGGGQG